MPLNLKNLDWAEFVQRMADFGVEVDVARRLFAAVFAHGRDLSDVLQTRGLRRAPRDQLRATAEIPNLQIVRRVVASDGFVKYLFELHDGLRIEAVRIPLDGPKYTLCLSTQVGCAMGCTFCETGRMGFRRNLETWEIVDQAMQIRREADLPVRGVVFMGMGEPLANYDAVIRAANILSHPAGLAISAKAITVSTVGLVPAIRRFTREGHKYRLAVSLTAATHEKRLQVMPIEQRHSLDELVDAIRAHAQTTGQRVMLQYVLIRGFNCGDEDVAALRALLAGIPVRLSIIECNDARGLFEPPSAEELRAFRNGLATLGQPVVRRYSGGKETHAACGMLAT
jgi:23S rRNA (adenine2503-C2)-methyltransferase